MEFMIADTAHRSSSSGKLGQSSHMLHHQSFDPDLSHYKKNLRPVLWGRHLFSLGPSFLFIYDYHTQQYVYVGKDMEGVLGHPPEVLYQGGVGFVTQCMRSEDARGLILMVLRALKHLHQRIPEAERSRYTVSFDYQIKHADGRYRHLLQQSVELAFDRRGNLVYSLERVTDISHRPPETSPMLSIYGPDPAHSLLYCPLLEPQEDQRLFTRAEMRVLHLLNEACSTQEIAARLNISTNTVTTHRRNMLKKAGVNTTAKLLRLAQRQRIL